MKTRDMLTVLQDSKYPLPLVAAQSGVSYMKLYRYCRKGGALSPDEKAKVWRFAIMQPVVSSALSIELEEEDG